MGEETEINLFQKLPEELLTKITGFMPLQQAARTSLISKQWLNSWRRTPNPHFDGNAKTKFRSNAYPISYFKSSHDFFNWMDRIIAQHEEKGIHDFQIESLCLNFYSDEEEKDEGDKCGWIELRNSDSVIVGGYRVVCLLSCSPPGGGGGMTLSDVLKKPRRRPDLLRKLTLRNCDEQILRSQIVRGGDTMRPLESVSVQSDDGVPDRSWFKYLLEVARIIPRIGGTNGGYRWNYGVPFSGIECKITCNTWDFRNLAPPRIRCFG